MSQTYSSTQFTKNKIFGIIAEIIAILDYQSVGYRIRRTGIGSDGQIVPPMFHTDEKVGLTTMTGSMIYNLDTNKIEYYNGSSWKEL